ncbi:tissue factor-like [Synchiropus splendidus]|uniref:tissue factor-like n=1 Tax=Synchiropus splendidus TaxID=270530 RepID=UPI00237E23CC|nr:tissue factor-like [Synchiropus splendidus]
MACIRLLLSLGVSAWMVVAADEESLAKADNVRWVSVDFKTVLTWSYKESDQLLHGFTVQYSRDGGDWMQNPDCIEILSTECDLTAYLDPLDRTYSADIQTEHNEDLDEFTHTLAPDFNPYRESEISHANFTVESSVKGRVTVVIDDPLTSIYERGKQLTIRDILKNDLKYKISYYKSGSTRKRDMISDSSTAEVLGLDEGHSYCFMVAAYIPSRPTHTQQGAWSTQLCTPGQSIVLDMSLGVLLGTLFVLFIFLCIIIIVIVLWCKWRKQRPQQMVHTSTVVDTEAAISFSR